MFSSFLIILTLLSMQIATPVPVDASIELTHALGSEPTSRPVLADGQAYITSVNGIVTAIDTDAMKLAWQAVPGEPVEHPVAVANGMVYVPGNMGTLFVLDASTGDTEIARSLSNQPLVTPLVHGDTVVVGTMDGEIYLLNSESLDVLDSFVIGTELSGPGVLAGDVAVFTLANGLVVAIDVEQREIVWQTIVGTEAGLSFALEQGDVVVGSNDGTLNRLSMEDGSLTWRQVVGGSKILDMAQSDNGLLVIAEDAQMHNLDLESGSTQWRHALSGEGSFGADTCGQTCVFSDGIDLLGVIDTDTGAATSIAVAPGIIADMVAADENVAVAVTEVGDIVAWSLRDS